MQTHLSDAWLVGIGALVGVLIADLVALAALWAWSRVHRSEPDPSAA